MVGGAAAHLEGRALIPPPARQAPERPVRPTRLAPRITGFGQVEFRECYVEDPPVDRGTVYCVISDRVINLAPDEPAVFQAGRGGAPARWSAAIADIVSAPGATTTYGMTSISVQATRL